LALTALTFLTSCGTQEDAGASTAPSSESSSAAPSTDPPTVGRDGAGGDRGGEREEQPSPSAAPEADLAVTVTGDEITPNAQELEVAVGEPMTVSVDSDRAGELHVHSTPEQYVDFDAGATRAELLFETPGSIEVEDHGTGAIVAFVEAR